MIDFDKARPEWRVMVRRHTEGGWDPLAMPPIRQREEALSVKARMEADGRWVQVMLEKRWCTVWQDEEDE